MEKDEIFYHPVAQSSSRSSSTDHGEETIGLTAAPPRRSRFSPDCLCYFSSLFLAASVAVTLFNLLYMGQFTTDEACTYQMNTYSPLIQDNMIKYHPKQYEGDFFKPSPYRGAPTLEKEKVWLDLWNHGPLAIPMHQLPQLNKSRELPWLKASPEYGDAVISTLEVHHQLHCLSTLRHWAYREEVLALPGEPPELLTLDKRIVWEHLDHCLEMLRLNIMCISDVTPIMYIKDPDTKEGWRLDFSTQHKCRNYEDVNEWVDQHSVPFAG